jgi:hypothetical protein
VRRIAGRIGRPVFLIFCAVVLMGTSAGCGGDDEATPQGAYEYTLSADEKMAFRAMSDPSDVQQLDGVEDIATRFVFDGSKWVQLWMLDGKAWIVDGHSRGSNGTFTIEGDRLATYEPEFDETHTYTWSLEDGTLSLKLVENSAGPVDDPGILMATQHDFEQVSEA